MQESAEQIATLIRDSLFEHRVELHGCFVHDPASKDLEECGASALPMIEAMILSDVEGNCHVFDDVRNDGFPGLLSVMRCYFMISDRFSLHANGAAFLRKITRGTRLAALDALHRLVYWDKLLPKPYESTLTELLPSVTPPEAALMNRILESHRKSTGGSEQHHNTLAGGTGRIVALNVPSSRQSHPG